jgi:N-acetylglucosaminyldiphosphoundecaprenol N-acetyl-beta-D-mannosaminyltransferase
VGAAFDFHSGSVKQAPGWLQRAGLEWFFRLMMEPRRLWKRYAWHNPRFVGLFAWQWIWRQR